MKPLFLHLLSFTSTILLCLFPAHFAYASNYQDSTYGDGGYGAGSTPTPVPGSTSNAVSVPNQPPTPCPAPTPGPNPIQIYAGIAQDSTTIILYFTDASDPYDHYSLEFGTASNSYLYGTSQFGSKGTRSITVSLLSPNTTYYFRVRAGNGCAAGEWSAEYVATTAPSSTTATPSATPVNATPVPMDASYQPILTLSDQSGFGSYPLGWYSATYPTPPPYYAPPLSWYSLYVNVYDPQRNPILGAQVALQPENQIAITKSDGVATFTQVKKGEHEVDIAYNNTVTKQTVMVGGDPSRPFKLAVVHTVKSPASNVLFSIKTLAFCIFALLLIMFLNFLRRKLKKK